MENKDAVNMVDEQVDQGSGESFSVKLMQLVMDHFGDGADSEKVMEHIVSAMAWPNGKTDDKINVIMISQREVEEQIDRKFRNAELISKLIKNLDDSAEIMSLKVSDGRNTFGDLYHHRAVLFMTICKQFLDKAWMSWKHYDGGMYAHMFIVGVDTPTGPATYHFEANPYWRLFQAIGVRELDAAPKWDGHNLNDTLDRIASLYEIEDIRGYKIGIDLAQEDSVSNESNIGRGNTAPTFDFANGVCSQRKEDI